MQDKTFKNNNYTIKNYLRISYPIFDVNNSREYPNPRVRLVVRKISSL